MMKKLILILGGFLFLSYAAGALAATDVRGLIMQGMHDLDVKKGNPNLCALTDAPYVKLKGKAAQEYVDVIQEETGCSIGKGNLLFFQRPVGHPLIVAIHREDSGDAVVIFHDGDGTNKVRFNIKGDTAADPKQYGEIMKMLKGDTFSVLSILTSHARGAPYEFLKCCEHHNHFCPGVTSGYFIAQLIQEKYPIGPGEQYIWFACPPWCKDDAVSTTLDLTPGKRNLYVKDMAEGQSMEGQRGQWAGIMVLWNAKNKKGKAIALQFDWNEAYKLAGLKAADFQPQGGTSNPAFFTARIKSSWSLIPYLDRPERFVSVVKEVEITPEMLKRMKMAGVNPYQIIGIVK
jgi:formylmethanofuran dehydrogenase subunit E-like metal-binding protein